MAQSISLPFSALLSAKCHQLVGNNPLNFLVICKIYLLPKTEKIILNEN